MVKKRRNLTEIDVRKEFLEILPDAVFPSEDESNPLYWFWKRYVSGEDPDYPMADKFLHSFYARNYAIVAWAWAVPSPRVIWEIAEFSKNSIVEVGTGSGYWAKQLADVGVDIIATDPALIRTKYYPVKRLKAEVAVSKYGHGRTLLLVWPPYSESVAYDALRVFEEVGGTRLIYVGEGYGGCTADDDFHEALGESETGWQLVATKELPRWYGLHDRVYYYEHSE